MSSRIDSLQDICIFYCVNHLDTLAALLDCFKSSNDENSSPFSMLLGNRILEYYFKCHITDNAVQPYIDSVLSNPQFCNSLTVNRKDMLTAENVSNLAKNAIRVVEFTCFDDYTFMKDEFEGLVQNNMKNLTRLKIKQKSTNSDIEGLLQLLSGEDFENNRKHHVMMPDHDKNSNHSKEKKSPNCFKLYLSKLGKHDKKERTGDSVTPSPNDESGSSDVDMPSVSGVSPKSDSLTSDNDTADLSHQCDMDTSSAKQHHPSDHYIPNLVSFHYNMCYSSLATLTNAYSVFDRLCCIIEKNTQLQSISIVSVMPNPCKWFLLNTDMVYKLENLHSLVLSHATKKNMDRGLGGVLFSKLPELKKLRHLDLSYGFDLVTMTSSVMNYSQEEVEMFREALKKMPNLKSIDLSGSNLCNIVGHADGSSDSECVDHCMPGFEGRRFDYIGLFNCETCSHQFIPALRVSGNMNEKQLLVAVWSYHHNQQIMGHVLTELRSIVAVEDCTVTQALPFIEGLLLYLEELGDWDTKYTEAQSLEVKNVTLTLINLFYLAKVRDVKKNLNVKTKRMIVERMFVLLKNGLDAINSPFISTAYHVIFRISLLVMMIIHGESVVVYCHKFESYIDVLIRIQKSSQVKHHVKILGLSCMHSAVRYSQEYKALAGCKLRLVQTLLEDVSSSMTSNPSNEQSERKEKIWSILWTLTDDVPSNCEKFVDYSGCTIALDVIRAQPGDNSDLLRKITGTLSNVSENLHLHPQLMNEDLVNLMRGLLEPFEGDRFDISSHAAAFLVLLAAQGSNGWTLPSPTHAEVLHKVNYAISHWKIEEPKGVRFRTLVPMLIQISNTKCSVAQYWGAWMVCNLMITKPEGYRDMLISENGLEIINTALEQPDVQDSVKEILQRIILIVNVSLPSPSD